MDNILLEAFKRLKLCEETFDLSSDIGKPDELKSYVADDVEIPVEEIIDMTADDKEDLQNSYVGKIIIECPCCRSKFYHDKDTIIFDQESNLANVDEACPICTSTGGFTIIGKIEDIDNKAEDEDKIEVEKHDDQESIEEDCKSSFLERKKKNIEKIKDESEDESNVDMIEEEIPVDSDNNRSYIKVDESIEIKAEDEDKIEVEKHDDGSMTVEVPVESKDETIAPLTDEDEVEIEENKPVEEEKVEVEIPEEPVEDEEITDIDAETFDKLGESFMKKVYSNVKNFNFISVDATDDALIVEGLITYTSGNTKNTTFKFNNACKTNNKLILEGTNDTFSNSKHPFTLKGKNVNGKFVCESLTYRYTIKTLNESNDSKIFKVSGKVTLK